MAHRLSLLALAGLLALPSSAEAQLLAFPGAEGAARYATGGRGGDVYRVTNLADSGAGSLRYGIDTAPASGRTIVFAVAGTIQLDSYLRTNGKNNLTIAGQTAPAGGITLAGNGLQINHSDNVVVQHLRIRPGYNDQSDPDAVGVVTSTNVMLDHLTASWGVDETISTTHDSNNVTVQWSTISQGLYEGGHEKGNGHSYGSLINGGAYTYHHNLYAHNKSRNPRAQDSGDLYLRLDFVNNVMFNPQDRFGYSDSNDPYDVNLVGNYAIKGPRSGSNDHLFDSKDADSHYYVAGNFTDTDQDGRLDGQAVNGDAVFRPGGDYTLFGSRLSAGQLPEVATHTAEQAYLQVLSRAGAYNYRDPVDRQLIRSVINQLEYSIGTEAEIGGLPTLPTGPAPSDSNADGVPDAWAASRGFSPTADLAATYAGSGYTYLEEYLHSLTPYAYAPAATETHTITTAYGRGADAVVWEQEGGGAAGQGESGVVTSSWGGPSGDTNEVTLLKFDLSQIEPGSLTDAALQLTVADPSSGPQFYRLYGVEHDAAGWDWGEATVDFDTAPGLEYDGDPSTLGVDPAYDPDAPVDPADVFFLGEVAAGVLSSGDTVEFDGANLGVFLNLAAFFEGEAQQGVVTLIVESIASGGAAFYSHEGSAAFAPRLVVDAVLAGLPGDFNGDGSVDAADYVVWRNTGGSPAELATWKANYGQSSGGGAVPEPGALGLALAAIGAMASRRLTGVCRGGGALSRSLR